MKTPFCLKSVLDLIR